MVAIARADIICVACCVLPNFAGAWEIGDR
jgi:hypothetical protein